MKVKIKNVFKKYFSFINKKNKFNTMEVIVIMIITVIFGMLVGGFIMYRKGALNTGIRRELNEFVSTYNEILNTYYDDVEAEGLLEAGVNGMVSFLGDPYSVFMDSEAATAFKEQIEGEYVGIGTSILKREDGSVVIQDINESGPAYKAGIRNEDILLKVDDKDISKLDLDEISELVKGKVGTYVKIVVKRNDKEMSFKVKRSNIDIDSVAKEVIEYNDKKIGYLVIDIFALNTGKQFESRLKELEKEKIDALIIDVRGNSGGYLSSAREIISLFLPKGKVIYQLKTKEKTEKIKDETDTKRSYPVAILVNGGSASASEVLTSSLKENMDALVIGTTTYGKSKVQKTQELSNGSTIKYTFEEWLTPSGESVNEVGIKPDYEVTYEASDTEEAYDTQLQKSLELLTE